MEREFRDFLKAVFKAQVMKKGQELLHGGLGVNLNLDEQLSVSDMEFNRMEKDLDTLSDKLAEEMIDEIEAKGFETPDDLLNRAEEVKQVTDVYLRRLVQSVK